MLVHQQSVSVAANATNANVFSNTRLEFAPEDGEMALYFNGSAIGLTVRVLIDGDEVVENTAINTQNRFPVVPEDLLQSGIRIGQGEKLTAEVSNTTAGALTVFFRGELIGDADIALAEGMV